MTTPQFTCASCPFFVPVQTDAANESSGAQGICRCNPPQASVVMTVQMQQPSQADMIANPNAKPQAVQVPAMTTSWPQVDGGKDWCGEHPGFAQEVIEETP